MAVAKKKKASAKKNPVRVRKIRVKMPKAAVLEVIAPKEHHPVIVHKAPGIVEVMPVHHDKVKDRESWWDYFFGY